MTAARREPERSRGTCSGEGACLVPVCVLGPRYEGCCAQKKFRKWGEVCVRVFHRKQKIYTEKYGEISTHPFTYA